MTAPRTALFLHIGGPYDDAEMFAPVDDDGTPPEINIIESMTSADLSMSALQGLNSKMVRVTYEREERFGDDGFYFVFVYRGQDVLDNAA